MKKLILIFIGLIFISVQWIFSQGCMEPASDEGVSVIGFIQPEFQMHETADGWTNSFAFRRARIGVTGNIPYDFSYYMMVDFSKFMPETPYLLDAFVSYNRFSFARLTFGQFKQPFSQELNTACHKLHTINRSKVVNELALPNRDQGLMIWGGLLDSKINYNLAFMNEYKRGVYDENNNKSIIGRVTVQPIDAIRVGGSFKKGVTGIATDNDVTRFAGEMQLELGGFLMQAEYIWGEDTGSYTTGGGCDGAPIEFHDGPIIRSGYYVQAMYMLPFMLQPVVKFESYDPDSEVDNDTNMGITGGFNYFFNDWTRVQLNYTYRSEGDFEVPNDCLLLQLQVNF